MGGINPQKLASLLLFYHVLPTLYWNASILQMNISPEKSVYSLHMKWTWDKTILIRL